MFITVKSGAGKENLFNLNCQVDSLIRSIEGRCPFDLANPTGENCVLDLMDEDGRTTGIYTKKGNSMGTDCLTERELYVLVLVKTDPKGRKYYESLLENIEVLYPDLKDMFGIDAIEKQQSRDGRSGSRKKSGKLRKITENGNGASSAQAALTLMAGVRARARIKIVNPKRK